MPESGEAPDQAPQPHRDHLLGALVRAVDWFDNGLQNALASLGFQRVHRTQSMILVYIARGISNPADIARAMGSTRQNVHHMARGLLDAGLIQRVPDSADPRRTRYVFSERAADVRSSALDILDALEDTLAERIGKDRVEQLRAILNSNWGEEVQAWTPAGRTRRRTTK